MSGGGSFAQRRLLLAGAGALLATSARGQGQGQGQGQAFDHDHSDWTALLRKHVVVVDDGRASRVRYAGFAKDKIALEAYLNALSSVSDDAFAGFGKAQQQAFLINAYNAFTIELILSKYPDLASIKDLGNLLRSPWKIRWVRLLGSTLSLDNIEHDMLRKPGRYDDPRVHFAVNCASIGCPMLREEAFVAQRLEGQLSSQARRFMSDRSRNRYNPQRSRLELSRIFDWYREDFESGHLGIDSLAEFAARYADVLADDAAHQALVRNRKAVISFLDYDWALNDAR